MLHRVTRPQTLKAALYETRSAKLLPLEIRQSSINTLQGRSLSHAVPRSTAPFRVAIIGSGPAGFYAAAKLIGKNEDAVVDMYEHLPVPFGLVRFGVAPDHPEVKNCQDRFTEVAQSPRFNFIGNVNLGNEVPLHLLKSHYDAILFAYGASKDRKLGLLGENAPRQIYSARAFVGWYNGLPEYRDLNPDLTAGEDAVVVGQGNVALDVARVLLTDIDVLRKTDMTDHALSVLSSSRIKNVRVVGRRGPVQAAFTIKEIRELMQLPVLHKTSLSSLPSDLSSLPRSTKRIMQLLHRGQISVVPANPKSWSLDFLLSPHSLRRSQEHSDQLTHVDFTRNRLTDPLSAQSGLEALPEGHDPTIVSLKCSTLFRSIGYKSEPLPGFSDFGIPFDSSRGTIPNDASGRVVRNSVSGSEEISPSAPIPGLYAAGWVKRGPTGVIASTMTDAFVTAEAMIMDWEAGLDFLNPRTSTKGKGGWEGVKADAVAEGLKPNEVDWKGWEKIDRVEKERGRKEGKEREKISSVREMLEIALS